MKWRAVLLVVAFRALAHDPVSTKITWSREVSRIVYAHCAACHREAGAAFPLTTWQQARPWAKAMKEQVLERRMPPWGAVKGFGDFRNDSSLTGEAMELVAAWAEGGAPEGDPALLPSLPVRPNPATAPAGAHIDLDGRLKLTRAATLLAIEPRAVADGSSLQVIARRPDGGIEPLLWLYRYDVRFPHPYIYREPPSLPAGTEVEVSPANAGALTLICRPR